MKIFNNDRLAKRRQPSTGQRRNALLFISIFVISVVVACTQASSTADEKPNFEDRMLAAHNGVREKATPMPNPALEPLTWSPQLARKAQSWAQKCRFEHNHRRGSVGENLAAYSNADGTVEQVVTSWAEEAQHYNLATNQCRSGEVCGHYTQMIWRATREVGCAKVDCRKNSPFREFPQWQNWVCNYSPPGNVIGRKPY